MDSEELQISDAFTEEEAVSPIALPEDVESVGEPHRGGDQANRIGALSGAALELELGPTTDPYKALADSLALTDQERAVRGGETLVNAVTETLDPNDPEAVDIGLAAQLDAQDPEIIEDLGYELVGDVGTLKKSKRLAAVKDTLEASQNGWETVGEFVKSMFIPLRTNLATKEVLGTYFPGKVDNIVDTYHASDNTGKAEIIDEVIGNVSELQDDDYWLEKMDIIELFTGNSSDEDIALMKLFTVMDLSGALGAPKLTAKVISKLGGRTDLAKVVNKANADGLSGRLAADAISNSDAAKATGVDPDAAIHSVITGDPSAAVGPTLDSLPLGGTHSTGVAVAFRRQMDVELDTVKDSLLPETFKKEEQLAVLDKAHDDALEQLKKQYNMSSQTQPTVTTTFKDGVASIDIEFTHTPKLKKDGTPDLRYKPQVETHKQTIELDSNAWGTMENFAAADAYKYNPASPKLKLRSTKDDGSTVDNMVENSGLVTAAQSRLESVMNDGMRVVRTQAGRTGLKRLNKVLRKQDADGKVLSRGELVALDPKLTNKQIDAYYMYNELFDIAGSMGKDIKFKDASLNGVKEFTLGNTIGFGKVYKSFDGAMSKAKKDIFKDGKLPDEILDHESGNLVKAADVDTYLQNNNKQIAVLDKEELLGTTGRRRVVIVDNADIHQLRRSSLDKHRVEGYVSRIRPNAKYFVRETVERLVDGIPVRSQRLRAASSNRADAQSAYDEAKSLLDSGAINKPKPSTDGKNVEPPEDKIVEVHSVQYDREGDFATGSDLGSGNDRTSGPFLGHRSTHDIEWRGASDTLDDPITALGKNLAHVSRATPLTEWKLAQTKRWENSVRAHGITDTPDIREALPISNTTDGDGRLLEESRQYLQGAFGVPDSSTQSWENMTINISEWMDLAPGGDLIGRSLRRNSQFNPINEMKYLAFHTMLGWFNPAQLVVQASNMATAASIHPWLTSRHFHKAMALRANLYASTPKVRKALSVKVGMDGDELEDMIQQFKRGGYDQINTNADMEAAIRGYGAVRDGFRRATDAGLIMYRQGELAGRTVTYTVARQAYMKANNIKNWRNLTDDDHRQIRQRFDNLSINLGRENKANFQTGVVSLPTQFLHVTTKFVEMFIGKKFTMAEKARLVLGQGMLFGAAGLPFGDQVREGLEKMFRDEEHGGSGLPIDSDTAKYGLLNFIVGEAAISGRVGLGNQATDTLFGIFSDSDSTPFWQDMMGASGTLIGRATFAGQIIGAFGTPNDVIQEDYAMRTVKAMAGMTSSFNNAEQAYMMRKHNEYINKKSGQYNFNNPTWQEILSKSLGFQSKREIESFEIGKANIDYQKWSTKIADKYFQQVFNAGIDMRSTEFPEEFSKRLVAFTEINSGGSEHDQGKLQSAIWTRLMNSTDKRTKALATMLKNQASKQFDPALIEAGLKERGMVE